MAGTACGQSSRLLRTLGPSEGFPCQRVPQTVERRINVLQQSDIQRVNRVCAIGPRVRSILKFVSFQDDALGRPCQKIQGVRKAIMPPFSYKSGALIRKRSQLILACGVLLSCVAGEGESVLTSASIKETSSTSGSSVGDRELYRACARDLLAVLSGGKEAESVSATRADKLLACVRPLTSNVPTDFGNLRTPAQHSSPDDSTDKSPSGSIFSPLLDAQGVRMQAATLQIHSLSNSSLRKLACHTSHTELERRSGSRSRIGSRQIVDQGRLKSLEAGFPALISQPPGEVYSLVRAVEAEQGKGSALRKALGPSHYKFPDCEGSIEAKCQLARATTGQRFYKQILNRYCALLFEAIAACAPSVGLSVNLSRFDLFHGHFFYAQESQRFGILFHAREYPAEDEAAFPVDLGFCQRGSKVRYDDTMNLRNLLWLAPREASGARAPAPGILCALDTRTDGILGKELVAEGLQLVHTIYEGDLGILLGDINYLGSLKKLKVEQRLFIC